MTENNQNQSIAALLEIAFGYQRASILFAFVRLKIADIVTEKPLSVRAISEKTNVHPLALDRLLNAAVALRLLEKNANGTFQNSEITKRFLIENTTDFIGEQFEFYADNSYANWTKLVEKLHEWQPGIGDEQTSDEEDQAAETLHPQHNLAVLVGKALARSVDFSAFEKMLDVGGGTGAMSLGICAVHPNLRATVWDLPKVIEKTSQFVEKSELKNRVEMRGGNFKTDDLPVGFDCILLANLLSVGAEETNRALFKRIYDYLPPNGAVVISGWIVDDNGATPEIAVLFSLEDVINQVPDVERTETTYRKWLEDAGFTKIEREVYFAPYSYITAVK